MMTTGPCLTAAYRIDGLSTARPHAQSAVVLVHLYIEGNCKLSSTCDMDTEGAAKSPRSMLNPHPE